MPRIKEAPLRVYKDRERTYKVIRTRLVLHFSLTTWNARRLWWNKSESLKKHDFQPRMLCAGAEKHIFSHGLRKGLLPMYPFLASYKF